MNRLTKIALSVLVAFLAYDYWSMKAEISLAHRQARYATAEAEAAKESIANTREELGMLPD